MIFNTTPILVGPCLIECMRFVMGEEVASCGGWMRVLCWFLYIDDVYDISVPHISPVLYLSVHATQHLTL